VAWTKPSSSAQFPKPFLTSGGHHDKGSSGR
jgi:hypothetical protein